MCRHLQFVGLSSTWSGREYGQGRCGVEVLRQGLVRWTNSDGGMWSMTDPGRTL